MKHRWKWIVVAFAVTAWCLGTVSWATEDLADTTGFKCTVCHDKAGSKLLTSKGKYFEYTGSLDGFDEVVKKYRKCTKCHAKYPGSQKLTKKGEALKEEGVTMDHIVTEPAKE